MAETSAAAPRRSGRWPTSRPRTCPARSPDSPGPTSRGWAGATRPRRTCTTRSTTDPLDSAAERVLAASRLVLPGEWTTYGDLGAAATGGRFAARLVARLAARHPDFANAHRVLGSGGVVVRGAGAEVAARSARDRLLAEGVPFRGAVADPSRRVRWVELRGRLREWTEQAQ